MLSIIYNKVALLSKSTVSSGFKGLVEFQFHNTSRSNMAIRWYYDNVLDIFKDNFLITLL